VYRFGLVSTPGGGVLPVDPLLFFQFSRQTRPPAAPRVPCSCFPKLSFRTSNSCSPFCLQTLILSVPLCVFGQVFLCALNVTRGVDPFFTLHHTHKRCPRSPPASTSSHRSPPQIFKGESPYRCMTHFPLPFQLPKNLPAPLRGPLSFHPSNSS